MSQTRISPTGLAHIEGEQPWTPLMENGEMKCQPAAPKTTDIPEFNFPDYTRTYKVKGPIHDSPGGPDGIRGYVIPSSIAKNDVGSEDQVMNNFQSQVIVSPGTGSGLQQQRPQETNQTSLANFNTGLLFQADAPAAQRLIISKNLLIPGENGNSDQLLYNSLPRSFSPGKGIHEGSDQVNRKQSVQEIHTNIVEVNPDETTGWEKSINVTTSKGSFSKFPSAESSSKNSNSVSKPATYYPKSFSVPKPFTPVVISGTTANFQPVHFSSLATPIRGEDNSSSLYCQKAINLDDHTNADSARFASSVPVLQHLPTNTQNTPALKTLLTTAIGSQNPNFTARPYKPPQAAHISSDDSLGSPSMFLGRALDDNFQKADGDSTAARTVNSITNSGQQQHLYKAVPFVVVPVPDASIAKPNVPAPPPAPLFQQQPQVVLQGPAKQKPPSDKPPISASDLILKSTLANGPKPFSYGVDLTELNKKISPATAPKPKYQVDPARTIGGNNDTIELNTDRERKNSTELLDCSNLVVGTGFPASSTKKKSAGHMQLDCISSGQLDPRSEIDKSPINVNMGVDPKKQSKSFKLLQWITETDQDDPNDLYQQPTKKNKDAELRHNADDDEMRFSGIHPKTEIPPKALNNLQKKSQLDSAVFTDKATLEVDDKAHSQKQESTAEESLEEGQAVVNMRYMGASIPSKVFKVLQKSLEDDLSEQKTFASDEGSNKKLETMDPSVSDF